MDIEPSARRHGVREFDMLHALRHHWHAFETENPAIRMYIGPSSAGAPLEVGVADDEAIIHAMAARPKFLKGWWQR
ncbi:MAG: hypothetical protein OXG57_03280 [Acidimicrobiaceae bacterium]|nr:hypothetical protein [Acidimicrobiaceae bacterium]MCY3893279.1 hypothetical protein [Acidimicrobiaceae bacterium]